MEFVKRYWTTIRAQAEGLPLSTKLLVGALVTIMLLVGFILVLYAGKPETVPISQFASSRAEEVVARLDSAGIPAELLNGQVHVSVNQRIDAIALLAREELLSENASAAFADLTGNPWETDAQGRRKFLLATQNYLNAVAGKFKGVKSAEVVISLPEQRTFGRSVRASASVTVVMDGSRTVDSHLTGALAGLVSGAVADMQPTDVVVLDANAGRQHTVSDPADVVPTEVIELVRHQEDYHRKKIEAMLGTIQGVIVAVRINTDAVRRETRVENTYEEAEPLRSEEDQEVVSRDFRTAAEPGARPNMQLSIESGGGLSHQTSETLSRREYGDKLLRSTAQIERAGHQVKQINVTINVPRSYFVSIFRANNPEAEAPDDAALEPIRTEQLAAIKKQVAPLIVADADAPGIVEANMIYDQAYLQPVVAGVGGAAGDGNVIGALTGSGTVATISAVSLGVIALGLALMMVRRATQPQELPSVHELAGVPPTLPTDDDLIGEADEAEASMAGLELDDDEVRTRHLAEQISQMIRAAPEDAGGLLSKWVQAEE